MPQKLEEYPVHLALGGGAVVQPAFTGMAWYADYGARHGADGADGRLVSMHSFDKAWDGWEMHPAGDEVVVCVAGGFTLIQQGAEGTERRIRMGAGDYAINPAGVWHSADLGPGERAQALFITAGLGTEVRAR